MIEGLTVEERLIARARMGTPVQLMTTKGGALLRRGHLHERPNGRFTFVSEADTTYTFGADDVKAMNRSGSKITVSG
jgi:hypothetical protein